MSPAEVDVLVQPLSAAEIRDALYGWSDSRRAGQITPEWSEEDGLEVWPVQRSHKPQAEWAGRLRTITPAHPFGGLLP